MNPENVVVSDTRFDDSILTMQDPRQVARALDAALSQKTTNRQALRLSLDGAKLMIDRFVDASRTTTYATISLRRAGILDRPDIDVRALGVAALALRAEDVKSLDIYPSDNDRATWDATKPDNGKKITHMHYNMFPLGNAHTDRERRQMMRAFSREA